MSQSELLASGLSRGAPRLLFLAQVLPFPLDAGPKVRAHYVLRQLAQTHRVTLVAFGRADDDPGALERLREWCESVRVVPLDRARWRDALAIAGSLASRQPWLIQRDQRRAMRAMVARLSAETPFQSVHADQLAMAQYALDAPAPQRVLDLHNAMWHLLGRLAELEPAGWRRALLWREARTMRAYEGRICRAFDQVVTVSEPDRARLAQVGAGARLEVVPICLDHRESEPRRGPSSLGEVSFIGAMHWPPNADGIRWFACEVWPVVERRAPWARLNVIGKHPPAGLQRDHSATITLHGYLDDPGSVLARTAVAVVPLRSGGGVRVKILEAWARGIPVVSTSVGAEGLEARHGEQILLADSPPDFARAVLSLLTDPGLAERLARNGRRLLETRYDWQDQYPRFSWLHGAAAASRR